MNGGLHQLWADQVQFSMALSSILRKNIVHQMQPLKIETHKISPVCLSIVVGFQSVRLPLASTPPILHSIFLTFSTPFWLAFGWVVMVADRQEFIFYSDRQLRMNFLGIFLLIIKVDKHFKVTYSYFLVLDSFKIVHHPELH